MAPFSIPTPCIVPCPLPFLGGSKSIDTSTKIELLCDTTIKHDIFYTLDGTKPQPYSGIVQGSRLIKYSTPFCLPSGKITVKAIAVHHKIHSMSSNVITKYFEVLKNKQTNNKCLKKNLKKKDIQTNLVSLAVSSINENEGSSNVKREEENFLSSHLANNIHLNGEPRVEDPFMCSDQNSLNSHCTEESVEDKTICDIDEVSLLDEQDPSSKYSDFESVKRNIMSDLLDSQTEDDLIQFEGSNIAESSANPCLKCDNALLECSFCQEKNNTVYQYCIHCGKQLQHLCKICNELNTINAAFCQFCGQKLILKNKDILSDFAVINESKKSVGIQNSSLKFDKCAQTSPFKMSKHSSSKMSPISKQKLPLHSPGRGYWHQQLDFICNHLKSFAYNDLDFRKSISEPTLSTFQTAEVIKNEDTVSVTIIFSALKSEMKSD